MAVSVTNRIKQIAQPSKGYLNNKLFKVLNLNEPGQLELEDIKKENVHPSIVGTVVDYLTRYMLKKDKQKAFHISLLGAKIMDQLEIANDLLDQIEGLDDISITAACQITNYDQCFRAGIKLTKPVWLTKPNQETINNIRTMVYRSLSLFKTTNAIDDVEFEFTFIGGYTNTVPAGDGDYLTPNTLWDFKVSVNEKINNDQTLQLLMYYIMGLHSIHKDKYKNIKYIAIFNPRLNLIHYYDVNDLSTNLIQTIEKDVICY